VVIPGVVMILEVLAPVDQVKEFNEPKALNVNVEPEHKTLFVALILIFGVLLIVIAPEGLLVAE
jgi:hypothetical protein